MQRAAKHHWSKAPSVDNCSVIPGGFFICWQPKLFIHLFAVLYGTKPKSWFSNSSNTEKVQSWHFPNCYSNLNANGSELKSIKVSSFSSQSPTLILLFSSEKSLLQQIQAWVFSSMKPVIISADDRMESIFQNSYCFTLYRTISILRIECCRAGFTPICSVLYFPLTVNTELKRRCFHSITHRISVLNKLLSW